MKISSKSKQLVFSGRIGPTVNYQWRGVWVMRSLPSQYNDARTEAQLAQRSLFKQTVGFASCANRVLKLGMNVASHNAQRSESNYFMRINKQCFTLVDGNLSVDYESLILSDGPVAPVAFGVPQMIDEVTISIDFEKNPLHRATKSDDLVYLVAYCPELDRFDISDPVSRRRNRLEMRFNSYWVSRDVHLWGFVIDCAGRASASQYIGHGIIGDFDDEESNDALATENDITDNASVPSDIETQNTELHDNKSVRSTKTSDPPTGRAAPE